MRTIFSSLIILLALTVTSVRGDVVVMKDGSKLDGKITLQTADLIKIQVAVTERINETKTIPMSDIAEILKTAPDDELFGKIQTMVPTPPLLSAEDYRSMLRTGPEDFLSRFADSRHKPKVEEIKKTLEEELDKVERGHTKLPDRWYSPQDKIDHQSLFESNVLLHRMKLAGKGGRYLNLIAAMREYEKLENEYFGTPAHAEAVTLAQQALPILGRQVQALRRDVDAKNAKWEADKQALDDVSRQRVEAARKREEEGYAAAVEADKKAGIKWSRVNPRSASNLDAYLSMASSEYQRIQNLNPPAIAARAKALVEVDEMIKKDELDRAKAKLDSAAAMPVTSGGGEAKTSKGGSGYSGNLKAKLNEKLAERAAIAKAKEEAQKSESLTADLKKSEREPETAGLAESVADTTDEMPKEETLPKEGDAETETAEVKSEQDKPEDDSPSGFGSLSTLSNASQGDKASKSDKGSDKKKSSSSKSDSSSSEKARPRPPVDSGGGFPMWAIAPIVSVLLIIVVVVLKIMGIGGKKEDEEEVEEGAE